MTNYQNTLEVQFIYEFARPIKVLQQELENVHE